MSATVSDTDTVQNLSFSPDKREEVPDRPLQVPDAPLNMVPDKLDKLLLNNPADYALPDNAEQLPQSDDLGSPHNEVGQTDNIITESQSINPSPTVQDIIQNEDDSPSPTTKNTTKKIDITINNNDKSHTLDLDSDSDNSDNDDIKSDKQKKQVTFK